MRLFCLFVRFGAAFAIRFVRILGLDAQNKASPLREGDRSGASFKAFCFETREAVAVVGVPISPLSHHCI